MKHLFLAIFPLANAWKLRSPEGNVSLAVQSQDPSKCADYACPFGFRTTGKEFGKTEDECCHKTCAVHQCGKGYMPNVAYAVNLFESDQDCCDITCEQAAAEEILTCKPGHIMTNAKKLAGTEEQCCAATCSVHNCSPVWIKDTSPERMALVGKTDEACCDMLCANVACDHGWVIDDTKADRKGTKPEDCCTKSCGVFDCTGTNSGGIGGDFTVRPSKRKWQAANLSECCEPQCRHHQCSEGYQKDVTKDDMYDPSDIKCCMAKCSILVCPKPLVLNPEKLGQLGNDKDFCCADTCSSFDCHALPGWANSTAKASVVRSGDPQVCCEPTCWQHTCPANYRRHKVLDDITPPSNNDCCEPEHCETVRNMTDVTVEGKMHCHFLSESECGTHFERFSMMSKASREKYFEKYGHTMDVVRSRLVPCKWDAMFKMCRINDKKEAANCVDQTADHQKPDETAAETAAET